MLSEEQLNTLADNLSEKGYGLIPNFLQPREYRALRSLIENKKEQGELKRAGIGSGQDYQLDRSVRGDLIYWISPEEAAAATQVYLDKLQELMRYINRSLFLSLKDAEIHHTVYPPGTFYQRHLDQFRHDDHRKLSIICYLNDDWQETDGGQLRLYLPEDGQEKIIDVLPEGGLLACFRSDLIEHEVLPATRHRYSVTGWLLDQLADLPFQN